MNRPKSDFTFMERMMMQPLAFGALLHGVEIGVYDLLERAPGPPEEVARELGLEPRATESLLRLLAAAGVVEERGGAFANLPPASEYLVRSSPFFQGGSLGMHAAFVRMVLEDLPALLKGEARHKEEVDEGWAERGMEGSAQHAMAGTLQDTTDFIAALPGFGGMRRMCDLGGNHGEFSMAVLDRNPAMEGEIADLLHVADAAKRRIARRGYDGRIAVRGFDLAADALPEGRYDLVLASHVLYGFRDELPRVLAMVHASLRPGGWFVAQHSNPESGLEPDYAAAVECITRLTGYKSHYIAREELGGALAGAGFGDLRSATAGQRAGGLLVAARRE
ncbi:MAG: methyltransferase [Desulfovibrionaceae bacterium]